MPTHPSQVDKMYKEVFQDVTYEATPIRRAPKRTKRTPLEAHREPLNSPMGVGKVWRPKGRK